MKEASAINLATLNFSVTSFSQAEDMDLEEVNLLKQWSPFFSSFSQLCILHLKENTFWSMLSNHTFNSIQINSWSSYLFFNSDAILIKTHQTINFTGLSEESG